MTSTQAAGLREVGKAWWIFFVTGVLWLIVSMVVLRFDESSRTTVGVIIGVVFVLGMLSELMMLAADSGGWKFLHGVLAVLFGLAAIWCFVQPTDAFWALASVLGFLFLMYGIFEILVAVMTKDVNPVWWLGLIVGILLLALAFWCSQQLVTAKADLLLFYVGLMALFRGISQIVFSFGLHHAAKEA
jgi:uncharacterized membrane protein HdeD (DUF308 family)